MKIHSIPGKLECVWNDEVKAVVDTWTDYLVKLEEFKHGVLDKALKHAKAHGGVAFIVDSSKATGNFGQDIQNFISTDVFPAFAKNGIKYFITIPPANVLTKMTVARFSAKAGPAGIKLVEVPSLGDAIKWLKQQKA